MTASKKNLRKDIETPAIRIIFFTLHVRQTLNGETKDADYALWNGSQPIRVDVLQVTHTHTHSTASVTLEEHLVGR